jgi:glycosyltransferase involved in cell wall biosynthesis
VTRLSVTIIAWNEEERLRACLESVDWADEIVVVDAESTDKTVSLAREFTEKVWIRPWPGFAAQKNFALDQVTGDWMLSLDADERVTPALAERIRDILNADGPADGYRIPRRNLFWGAWVRHGGLYPNPYAWKAAWRRSASRCSTNRIAISRISCVGRTGTRRSPLTTGFAMVGGWAWPA